MSARTQPNCSNFTFKEEGGFVDNVKDPGGATNFGITLRTLSAWREDEGLPAATVDDVRNLSRDEATAIWASSYWNAVRGDDLPAGVDMSVSDFAFNASPKRAAMLLQQSVGLHGTDVDGWVGPQTLALVGAASVSAIITDLAARKGLFYRSCADWDEFGHGWMNRVDACLAASKALAQGFGAPPVSTPQPTADQLDAEYNPGVSL